MKNLASRVAVLLAMLVLSAGVAGADTFNFTCISNNSGNCPSIAPQMTVVVTAVGSNQVSFQFFNAGPTPATISDIYWEAAGLLASFASAFPNTGTAFNFVSPANPSNLPGGNTLAPTFQATFSSDAANPGGKNAVCSGQACGIDPGETITFVFNVTSGFTGQDVINAMNANNLRVGIHVTGISPTGNSDGMVTVPNTPVPEPASMILLGTGLLGLAGLKRKFRK